jgi:hypothetical protein
MRGDEELLRLTGISRRELDCYDDEVLMAWRAGELDEETVWRIRRVHRLRRQLGLDYEALEIIVRLVDRIERLEGARGGHDITVRVLEE